MAMATRSREGRSRAKLYLHKPAGVISTRVQAVGPERFGIVSVDCAKARSKWMLSDFYGRVLVEPTPVEHTRPGLQLAVELVRATAREHGLKEVLVAVERTGNYHRPVQRAFAAAGFETRVVHPFATKQFRQPANPGDKTDDHDLAAIHRATVVGFGLIEAPLDGLSRRLRLLVRHRRDLVRKCAADPMSDSRARGTDAARLRRAVWRRLVDLALGVGDRTPREYAQRSTDAQRGGPAEAAPVGRRSLPTAIAGEGHRLGRSGSPV